MSYSDNFPLQRASLLMDFANGGKIDPRATFSRASTANVFDGSKHLSSDNLLLQSSAFNVTWSRQGLGTPTGGQTDPAGGTYGFTLAEDSATNFHRIYQNVTSDGKPALTIYAKQNSGSRYLLLTLFKAVNDWECAVFDLAGSAPATASGASSTFTGVTATQTASGGGYYKCVLTGTGTANDWFISINDDSTTAGINANYGVKSYAGDGTSSIDVAFASLSTTGATDYNATTTQIHREYASSLASKANNIGRFEVGTDGQSAGTSLGILVEGQSTNLLTRSEDVSHSDWAKVNSVVEANAAVAPDGTLTADKWHSDSSAAASHQIYRGVSGLSSGTAYTVSAYFKAAGYNHVSIFFNPHGSIFSNDEVFFNLSTGAVGTKDTDITASIEDCGNGWYRCRATRTAAASGLGYINFLLAEADSDTTIDGDAYSGVLAWGFQVEASSFASSYTKTEAATVTRAADSMSVVSSSLFDNGSGALTVEYDMQNASTTSYVLQTARSTGATNSDGVTIFNEGLFVNGDGSNTRVGNTTSNVFHKVAASWETGSQKFSRDGSAVAEDTTTVVPQSGTEKLHIGTRQDGAVAINGHIKRLAIYSEPLSSTNLISLSS